MRMFSPFKPTSSWMTMLRLSASCCLVIRFMCVWLMRLIVEVSDGLQIAEELDDIGGIEVMVIVPADALLNVSPLAEDGQSFAFGDIFPTLSGEEFHDRSGKFLDRDADVSDGKAIEGEVGA